MQDLYLIVEIAGQRAVLPAAFVESVVEIEEVAPVPCAPAHVFGLFALRSRVLTVIDTIAALGGERSSAGEKQAVIVTVDGHLRPYRDRWRCQLYRRRRDLRSVQPSATDPHRSDRAVVVDEAQSFRWSAGGQSDVLHRP